jgi:hypothetical protein
LRWLGLLMFLLGGGGVAFSTWAVYHSARPKDVLFAVAAPLAALITLTGLVLTFVPGFFG